MIPIGCATWWQSVMNAKRIEQKILENNMSTILNIIGPEVARTVRAVLDKHALGAARAAVDSAGLRVFLDATQANDLTVMTAMSELEVQCGMAAQIRLTQDQDPVQRDLIARHAQVL